MRVRSTVATALTLAVLTLAPPGRAAEPNDAYRLEIGDRVSVMAFGRADLTGEFTIGIDSAIRLPLLGAIPAAGRSRSEIEAAVVERLSATLGYDATVTVDIAAYRPVFVIGDVTTPGEIVYTPGMTALQAFAKAGGSPSLRQLPAQVANQMAAAQRDLMMAQTDLNSWLVRRAALQSALSGSAGIVLPDELAAVAHTPGVAAALAAEKALLDAGREDVETRAALLTKERAELDEEVKALQRLIGTLDVQLEVVTEEVKRIDGLRERGLATSQRMLELRRSKATTDSSRHEAAAFLSRARQEIIQLDARLHALKQEQRRLRLEEQRTAEGEISRARMRVEGAARQMAALGQVSLAEMNSGRSEIAFAISRNEGGTARTFAGPATMPLHPGDIVQVTVGDPRSGSAGLPPRQAALSASTAD